MAKVTQDITLADELDSDGDLEIIVYVPDLNYDMSRWLNRDEAKALVDHINKLFNFEQEHNEQ